MIGFAFVGDGGKSTVCNLQPALTIRLAGSVHILGLLEKLKASDIAKKHYQNGEVGSARLPININTPIWVNVYHEDVEWQRKADASSAKRNQH